jgi:GNAT superfamily N-acetyltransferase
VTPAPALQPEALHAAFVAAFTDYLTGPVQVPLEGWAALIAQSGTQLDLSRVVCNDAGEVQAFAFVAPRPRLGRWRLSAMGAVPAARGSGAAKALLLDFIARGQQAGLQGLELECFAQNTRARALYERHGFEALHALNGWRREDWRPEGVPCTLQALSREAALDWLAEAEAHMPALPLQVGPTTLGARSHWDDVRAWRLGQAQLVLQQPAGGPLRVLSLVDRDPSQQDAEALLMAVGQRHPGADWRVPQLQRDDLGGSALQRLGFTPEPLHQLWMHKAL